MTTLGDEIRLAIPDWRVQANSLMVDTVTISRGGAPVFDSTTGLMTTSGTVVYDGPGRLRQAAGATSTVFGETEVSVSSYLLDLPYDVADIRIDDTVVVTESEDPHVGTRTFRVTSAASATMLAYRLLSLELVQ